MSIKQHLISQSGRGEGERQDDNFQYLTSRIAKSPEESFCQNSLILVQREKMRTLFVPAYLRCHFRNMTEMDIQNLSCTFIATMNIAFYLGKFEEGEKKEEEKVKRFAENMHEVIKSNLKITFQNDFIINMAQDISSSTSDSDRLVRVQLTKYTNKEVTRYYSNIIITRGFKFGLHSESFFFPLEQNLLDLVTTLHAIRTKMGDKTIMIRFNCMNLEIGKERLNKGEIDHKNIKEYEQEHKELIDQLQELYMLQNNGMELPRDQMVQYFIDNSNHPFFRDIKLSFPSSNKATTFGYYNIIQKDIKISYSTHKYIKSEQSCYQKLKNCLFCRKKIVNYDQNEHQLKKNAQERREGRYIQKDYYQGVPSEDRSREQSFNNAIMTIPMLKASLGTIIQLCTPIFFLSFLTLVTFLYSRSTTADQVRGLKISSSTLIVATYIKIIYQMRSVIPPTPSWSIFEVAVCLLAASCLAPIIESIYQSDIVNVDNPFLVKNGLFIASFILNASLCLIVVIMLIGVSIYMDKKIVRDNLRHVPMGDLVNSLTKKYFYLWKNAECKEILLKEIDGAPIITDSD